MLQESLFIILALLSGVVIAIYLPMNSMISRIIGSPIAATIIFFLGALFSSIIVFIIFGDLKSIRNIIQVPPYLLVTGIAGALMVLLTVVLIPKIGARKMFLLLLSGQVIMAMIVSHFGLFESPRDPISIRKIIGAGAIIIGAVISLM
jgi:transporter family-2 protein